MSSTPAPMTDCPNCGAALTGAYCAACGQKSAPANPSMRDVLHEAAHEFLNVDGKTLRSIRLLALSPGALTRELFAGRRASSVTALRLYLVCSLLYFATAALTPSAEIQFTVGASTPSHATFGWSSERRSSGCPG